MTYNIIDIQGIGTEFAEKLKAVNIHTTDDLLKYAPDEKSIKSLAVKTGITENLFTKWTKMAGLMRVNGIGPQYAELLFFSGVETVEKLREQPVDKLLRKLGEVNATRNLTNGLPNIADVQKWMQHAKEVQTPEPVVTR